MNRRKFITFTAGAGIVAGTYALVRPHGGFMHPCLQSAIPNELVQHEIVQAAWEGIDPEQFWDCHVHLVGVGHGDTGAIINPNLQSLGHPLQYMQYKFYLNATCTENEKNIDAAVIAQLMRVQDGLNNSFGNRSSQASQNKKTKLMLLAFDQVYDEAGNKKAADSAFYIPNKYAQSVAKQYSDRFEWTASVHPYRKDSLKELSWCIKNGARSVKWLPPAMGINPGSKLCDDFYDVLAKNKIPLLVHAGGELAVAGHGGQDLGNPLLLRRPLERGVKVLVAHCASSGQGADLDQGKNGKLISNFDLFARLMHEEDYINNLFGEISAITQINRIGAPLETILKNKNWHDRIVNGSDYPLPAIMPLFSLKWLQFKKYITATEADVLAKIRVYNPLLFDFVLKRTVRYQGMGLPAIFFHTKKHFKGLR